MDKKAIVEDSRLTIRAAISTVLNFVSADDAIRVLKGELQEIERFKAEGQESSDEFLSAICHAGTLVVDCEHCGRTHFATYREGDYEDGQLERLRRLAKLSPEKYAEHGDTDCLSYGSVNGKIFVWGCPCNGARQYEAWIWSHRFIIAAYLSARAKKQKEEADYDNDRAEKVTEAVNITY